MSTKCGAETIFWWGTIKKLSQESTLTAEGFVNRSFPHCWKHQYKKSKCIFCFHLVDAEGCQHNRLTHLVSTFSTQTVVSWGFFEPKLSRRSRTNGWKHQYKTSKCIFCFHLFDADGCQHNIRSTAESQLAPQADKHRGGKCFRLTNFVSIFSTQTVVSMTEKLPQTHNWLHKLKNIVEVSVSDSHTAVSRAEEHRGGNCIFCFHLFDAEGCWLTIGSTSWTTSWW